MSKHVISAAVCSALLVASPAASQASNGPLAQVSDGKLFLQSSDGGPATLRAGDLSALSVAASRDGSQLAVVRFDPDHQGYSRVALLPTAGGGPHDLTFKGLSINSVDISSDGRTLAITAFRQGDDNVGHVFAYLARIDGRKLRSLRTATRFAYDLKFAPNGKSLVYVGGSLRGKYAGCSAIRRIRPDGTHDKLLYRGTGADRPCPFGISLAPDGSTVAMTAATGLEEPAGPGPPTGVYRLSLRSQAKPTLLSQTADTPAWSPDGTQIAFSGFGRDDLRYPGKGPHGLFRVASAGGIPSKIADRGVTSLAWAAALRSGGR